MSNGQTELPGTRMSSYGPFAASHLQQKAGSLKISDLRVANSAFNELKQVVPKLFYRSPSSDPSAYYLFFSDAAQGKQTYGQTGLYLGDTA